VQVAESASVEAFTAHLMVGSAFVTLLVLKIVKTVMAVLKRIT